MVKKLQTAEMIVRRMRRLAKKNEVYRNVIAELEAENLELMTRLQCLERHNEMLAKTAQQRSADSRHDFVNFEELPY